MPRRIQAAVATPLGGLGVATRQFLETARCSAGRSGWRTRPSCWARSPAALLPAVDEALAAGVLVATQDALAFRHEMVWQAVSQTLPLPVRQALHRQIGEILLPRGGSAASAAAHLLSCGQQWRPRERWPGSTGPPRRFCRHHPPLPPISRPAPSS